jgi:hypothetical protein
VPRRSVIPEGPVIPTLPVLAALDTPALLEVDSCEFRRARVRCQIKAPCLERLGRCITRYRSATCLRSRGLAWFRRSLKLGLSGCCRRGFAWFRHSLNLGLSGCCRRGLAWFRYSLNLGVSGCRRGPGWFRYSLNLGWFACRPRYVRSGRSPFRWRRFLFFLLRAIRGECERKAAE